MFISISVVCIQGLLMLQYCVCLCACCLSVTLCIVAKRCILEQKLLLTAHRKSYMGNRLVPKWMTWPLFRGRIKIMSTIALHSRLNISETIRDRGLVPTDHQ